MTSTQWVLLVENRRVTLLGIDSAAIDYGASMDFTVHRIAAASDVGALENLANLQQLPATGSLLIALPMKIGGGSGGLGTCSHYATSMTIL